MAVFACGLLFNPIEAKAVVYLSPLEFIAHNFELKPEINNVWLNEKHQQAAIKLFGHRYGGLRIRYWQTGTKTAWILEEIGKEKPITIGVIIDRNLIEKVVILAFRETRGGEVRHPFFTRQFTGLFLRDDMKLSSRIDGITGATLSVRAVSNVSRYALYLHEFLNRPPDKPKSAFVSALPSALPRR